MPPSWNASGSATDAAAELLARPRLRARGCRAVADPHDPVGYGRQAVFAEVLFGQGVAGLSLADWRGYLKHVADRRLAQLGTGWLHLARPVMVRSGLLRPANGDR